VLRGASVSDRAVGSMGALPLLQYLDVRGCGGVGSQAIEQFLSHTPGGASPDDNFVQLIWGGGDGEVYFGMRGDGLCC
jgi:hypothetical protein